MGYIPPKMYYDDVPSYVTYIRKYAILPKKCKTGWVWFNYYYNKTRIYQDDKWDESHVIIYRLTEADCIVEKLIEGH